MNILVTGAKGMVGRSLCANLKNLRDGKNKTRPNIIIDNIFEFDVDTDKKLLFEYCAKSDFVFNLAGIKRPKDNAEFKIGNTCFLEELLDALIECNNTVPVMLSSSIQASLSGRFANSDYGRSKLEAEELLFDYGINNNTKVAVYRFPNLMGHSRPHYNSAVSTFCYAIANDLPYTVNDHKAELELLYIDDLMEAMFDLLEGKEKHCEYDGIIPIEKVNGKYCFVPLTHTVSLGYIVDLLKRFKSQHDTLVIPTIPNHSFEKKLYSLFLTYLPKTEFMFPLKMNCDTRGSFTELLKTESHGQFSVNISKPGITKG